MRQEIISTTAEATFDQIECSFFCKTHMAHIFGAQTKSFQVQNFIFGGLGRHFFQTLFTFRKLRIISKIEDLVVCGYGFMRYKGN